MAAYLQCARIGSARLGDIEIRFRKKSQLDVANSISCGLLASVGSSSSGYSLIPVVFASFWHAATASSEERLVSPVVAVRPVNSGHFLLRRDGQAG